jgi:hypothetical protein
MLVGLRVVRPVGPRAAMLEALVAAMPLGLRVVKPVGPRAAMLVGPRAVKPVGLRAAMPAGPRPAKLEALVAAARQELPGPPEVRRRAV